MMRNINRLLGMDGYMIASSKSGYRSRHPNEIIVFNANICVGSEKVWWGDINVTESKDKLIELAKLESAPLYVLSEMDGRFENECAPRIENALVTFFNDGTYELCKYIEKPL